MDLGYLFSLYCNGHNVLLELETGSDSAPVCVGLQVYHFDCASFLIPLFDTKIQNRHNYIVQHCLGLPWNDPWTLCSLGSAIMCLHGC